MEVISGHLETLLLAFGLLTVIGSWFGSWFAIRSALKIHDHRLDSQKELLVEHKEDIKHIKGEIIFLKTVAGIKGS